MLRRFSLLIAACAFGFAACTSSTITTVPPPPLGRGAVLSLARTATVTRATMDGGAAGRAIARLGGKAECDVAVNALRYATIGVHGEPADASSGCDRRFYSSSSRVLTLDGHQPH